MRASGPVTIVLVTGPLTNLSAVKTLDCPSNGDPNKLHHLDDFQLVPQHGVWSH